MARISKSKTSRRPSNQSQNKPRTAAIKKQTEKAASQKKVTGTVLRIVNGSPTDERLSAEQAFGDARQAIEQVVYAEGHGSREELRLVRLAFRQYQGKRFRLKST